MPAEHPPEIIPLHTQKFGCFFQTSTGFLRRVKSSGVEVIRAIYGTVRDKNWDTIEPRLEIGRVEQGDDSFSLQFTAHHESEPLSFSWKGTIEGRGGVLEFTFDGRAAKSFLRNRIGLCVLHPIVECAGKPCRVRHSNGAWKEQSFPRFISPHQPLQDIRALSWSPSECVHANIELEGEVFEMEDQRNWTDASFKTYSTPLELPFPVEVGSGEQIRQRFVLSLDTEQGTSSPPEESPVKVIISAAPSKKRVPKIGLSAARDELPHSLSDRERLARLRLNHLRVDLRFSDPEWRSLLARAQEEVVAINSRLQCALFLTASAEQNLLDLRAAIRPEIVDVCLIFHEAEKSTAPHWLDLAERHLGQHGFRLATGTNAYFAELNRQRPPRRAHACYSINPQVHTFDDLSLLETLEAQPSTVESAAQLCDGALIVSPITLRPRFNPNATDPAKQRELPSSETADPRQQTPFCAAWTVGTLAQLMSLDRIESLTFYETTGSRGIMNSQPDSSATGATHAGTESIFPVYNVFEAIAGIRNVLPISVSNQALVTAFAFQDEQGQSIALLANPTAEPKPVTLHVVDSELDILKVDEIEVARTSEAGLTVTEVGRTRGQVKLELAPHVLLKLQFG
jgi:D-apionolactonase